MKIYLFIDIQMLENLKIPEIKDVYISHLLKKKNRKRNLRRLNFELKKKNRNLRTQQ